MGAMRGLRDSDRSAGVILHPTSLPGPYGIGDLGREAYRWVDLLADSGTSLWQILPLGPTGYGDSPYQCFSAFAGNVNLISPDLLVDDGLLPGIDGPGLPADHVDYGTVIPWKRTLLAEAHRRFIAGEGDPAIRDSFERFRVEQVWLDDYALFMAVKAAFGGGTWQDWPDEFRLRETGTLATFRQEHADDLERIRFSQFLIFRQWGSLHDHAAQAGVRVIGDLPIFVAGDSADVWASPERFLLDAKRHPLVVAGVPPDYFSSTGQLWGNPLYDWDHHAETGFMWWADRLRSAFELADIVRIDHFRAFADYWAIPADADTAIEGEWRDGPGMAIFDALRERLGDLPIIAEDLGDLSDKVPALLEQTGFPGMRVLTFGFSTDESDPFLPHNYPVRTVAYTGTHDNDTTLGWWNSAPAGEREFARRYLSLDPADPVGGFLDALWDSRAMFAIAPVQDLLRLGSSARMNTPGTTDGNWRWRLLPDQLVDDRIAGQLRDLNDRYGRVSGSHVS